MSNSGTFIYYIVFSRAERRVSSSDDNDESGWLCKPNTQVDGRTLNRKPPPKTNFLVSRRAVLSSESEFVSEEEEKEEDDYFQSRKVKLQIIIAGI